MPTSDRWFTADELAQMSRPTMDRAIAISGAVRRECLAAGIPEDRLRTVMSGVDLDRARGLRDGVRVLPPREALRDAVAAEWCPRKKRRLFLLDVASLTGHKGHIHLLRALPKVLAEYPNAHLLLAGEGELREELASAAKRLGLAEDVSFMGFRDDVPALLSAADVYVTASRLEGLGTSVMDAMAAGLPVVASRAGGHPELVEDGATGRLVEAGDAAAMAAGLLEVLGNQKLRERWGKAGAARAERSFGKASMVEGTLAVYRELGVGGRG